MNCIICGEKIEKRDLYIEVHERVWCDPVSKAHLDCMCIKEDC